MSEEETRRDKEIADLIIRTYQSQYDLREKLDSKLNNFIGIIGTITTLSVGIALFVFDKIPPSNPYYWHLVITFFAYLFIFIGALVLALHSYKPAEYTWYPDDPVSLIKDYTKLPTENQVTRKIAGSYAKATNLNKLKNAQKSRTCNKVFWLFILGIGVIVIFSLFMILALGIPPTPTKT
jgi:cytochrome bd-type quinol oxidase subunit 1